MQGEIDAKTFWKAIGSRAIGAAARTSRASSAAAAR